MAKKQEDAAITKLYEKMGRVAYLLSKAEGTLRQAQAAHQRLQKEAGDIASEIYKAETKTGG